MRYNKSELASLNDIRQIIIAIPGVPRDAVVDACIHNRMDVSGHPGKPARDAHPQTSIYRASSKELPHDLAVKFYNPASVPDIVRWLSGEARVLQQLSDHAAKTGTPALAGALYGHDAAASVIVSEWIDGTNLRTWLSTHGRLRPAVRSKWIAAASRWLALYHAACPQPGKSWAVDEMVQNLKSKLIYNSDAEWRGDADIVQQAAAALLNKSKPDLVLRHGDFSPNNLIMTSGDTLRAIDFSNPQPSPREMDAVPFLTNRSLGIERQLSRHANPWQGSKTFDDFAKGYADTDAGQLDPHWLSLFALEWCLRRIAGLTLSSQDKNRAWYDRLDRKRELARHKRLAALFCAHLQSTLL